MSNATYKLVEKEAQFLRDSQIVRYQYSFPVNVTIPNNNQRQGQIVVDDDADFFAQFMTGKCIGPTDVNGRQLPAEPTNFPVPGTLLGFAQSGLQMSIKDGGSGIELTDGAVNCEIMLTPAYGLNFIAPLKWEYYVKKNSKLVYKFFNRDEAVKVGESDLFHFVSLALHGKKFTGKTAE